MERFVSNENCDHTWEKISETEWKSGAELYADSSIQIESRCAKCKMLWLETAISKFASPHRTGGDGDLRGLGERQDHGLMPGNRRSIREM
jgi:hypothetical protein